MANTNNNNNNNNLAQQPSGWDATATAFSKYVSSISPKSVGFSTLYAIDALELTVPKERRNEKLTILDIACGSGPLSIYGSLHDFKNTRFIATDFSPKMIDVLNSLIKQYQASNEFQNISNVETAVMDGQNLELIESNSIDYTFSVFGLIFFPSIEKGLSEMYRVLKPNNSSKTGIASWCKDAFLIQVFQDTMDELLTEQNNGIPTKYQQTALSLSDESIFKNSLESAGFKDIKITKVQHSMELNEFEDILVMFSTNPVYIDCLNQLNSQELKDKFNPTFIKYMKSKNPQRSPTNNKLQLISTGYIGIGTK